MTEELMYNAGVLSKGYKWTDEELLNQIRAIRLTVAYLNGRCDAGIVVSELHKELVMFGIMAAERGLTIK